MPILIFADAIVHSPKPNFTMFCNYQLCQTRFAAYNQASPNHSSSIHVVNRSAQRLSSASLEVIVTPWP
jgi:hypothetical protein